MRDCCGLVIVKPFWQHAPVLKDKVLMFIQLKQVKVAKKCI